MELFMIENQNLASAEAKTITKKIRRKHSREIYKVLMKTCQAYGEYENQFVYGLLPSTESSFQHVSGPQLGKSCKFRFPELIIEFPSAELTEERKVLCEHVFSALTPLRDLLATDEWDNFAIEP
jgi:hypothetical protein